MAGKQGAYPQQPNSYDCGFCAMSAAMYLSINRTFDFDGDEMFLVRKWTVATVSMLGKLQNGTGNWETWGRSMAPVSCGPAIDTGAHHVGAVQTAGEGLASGRGDVQEGPGSSGKTDCHELDEALDVLAGSETGGMSFGVRTIKFGGLRVDIVLQSVNGPCPLIAVGE
jgi:hypothetical protein